MNEQQYLFYITIDFLNDPDFILAIKHQDKDKQEFWHRLIAEKAVDEVVFNEAVLQLQLILDAEVFNPPAGFIDALERDIQSTIQTQKKVRILKLKRAIAAISIAASLFIGIIGYWFYNSELTITTGYAQTKNITLSDGSLITLNSSSSVSYPRALGYGAAREVHLKGEAFFNVAHLNHDAEHVKPGENFTVQTAELKIEVLGTKFNVKSRRGKTEVYLVKGRVRISDNHQTQIMHPEELASYQSGRYAQITVPADSHLSWMKHEMLVHNTSLKVVLENFEDVFGKKVILQDTSLYRKAIDGKIMMQNEENTLFIISAITNCNVVKQGDHIYLIPAK